MGEVSSVKASFDLLPRRARIKLMSLAVAQGAVALLDLVAVLTLGLVTAAAVAYAAGRDITLPGPVRGLVEDVQWGPSTIGFLAAIAGVLLITKSLLSFQFTRVAFRFLARQQVYLSTKYAEELFSRPLVDVTARSSLRTAQGLTLGVDMICYQILGQATIVFAEAALVVVLLGGLLLVSPALTLIMLIYFAVIAIVLQRVLGRWARRLGRERAALDVESTTTIQRAIVTYRETTVLGRQGLVVRQFRDQRNDVSNYLSDAFIVGQVGKYVFEIALVLGLGLLVLVLVPSQDLAGALGTLALCLLATSRIFPSLLRIQSSLVIIRDASGYASPTFELIDFLEGSRVAPSPQTADWTPPTGLGFVGAVTLRGVSYTYPRSTHQAISDVTLEIPSGELLAIVGPSGAGKSTLADVLLGVIEPTEGEVNISSLPPLAAVRTWPGKIAYVPQNCAIFDGTVRDNVAIAVPVEDIQDEDIWKALRAAHLDDVVMGRQGLDMPLGEGGLHLSGGQRQRLGIARSLYSRPSLLILDEATSALDADTELLLTETLRELAGSMTIVVIAHRLATVRTADRVAYMDGGKLVAVAGFEELRSQVADFDRQATLLGLVSSDLSDRMHNARGEANGSSLGGVAGDT